MDSMRILAFGLAIVAATAGCRSSSDSTLASTLAPSLVTDTFTGTVDSGGSDTHPFTVGQAGGVSVTLTAAGPPSTITMGVGVGTLSGSNCALVANGFTAGQASAVPLLSGSLSGGQYCVAVFDVGNVATTVSYSVTVVHP